MHDNHVLFLEREREREKKKNFTLQLKEFSFYSIYFLPCPLFQTVLMFSVQLLLVMHDILL